MSLHKLTKEDIFAGAKLLCIYAPDDNGLYTTGNVYEVVRQLSGAHIFPNEWLVEDDEQEPNRLNYMDISDLISSNCDPQFSSYDSLTYEQKVLLQLHRDVDQL